MLHFAMNPNSERRKGFTHLLRLLAGAVLVAFAFTILAAPTLLAPRQCSMPCCHGKFSAAAAAAVKGCQTQCGIKSSNPPQPLPRTVETSVPTTTHVLATVVAVVQAPSQVAPTSARYAVPAHPADAPLHVLNSTYLI